MRVHRQRVRIGPLIFTRVPYSEKPRMQGSTDSSLRLRHLIEPASGPHTLATSPISIRKSILKNNREIKEIDEFNRVGFLGSSTASKPMEI